MYVTYNYNYTRYLFYTSFLFLISSLFNYYYKFFYSCIFIFFLFLTSILYWNNPDNNVFKKIDLFMVKIVALFYFINSFFKNEFDRQFLNSLGLSIIIFYFIEHVLDFYKNSQWIIFHMAIHIYASLLFIIFLFV
jgi:hypothetical protein